MTARVLLGTERRITASPVWLRLVDTFTGHAPAGPIEIVVERRVGTSWVPLDFPYQLKTEGDFGLLDLGRNRGGAAGPSLHVRITATAPCTVAETAAGGGDLELTIPGWGPDTPPPPAAPQAISFYPGPDYRFAPGTPVLAGRVVDSAAKPVTRARVTATETVRLNTVIEEVRTGDDGWFRLPLRWSAGSTRIDADRLGAVGSAIINLPTDLDSVVLIQIS